MAKDTPPPEQDETDRLEDVPEPTETPAPPEQAPEQADDENEAERSATGDDEPCPVCGLRRGGRCGHV